MKRFLRAVAMSSVLATPISADPGDEAARYAERIDKIDDSGPKLNAVMVFDRDGAVAAIAGYPHLTVPMGAVEGLPVGLSFSGGKWKDHAMLGAGAAYERVRSVKLQEPSFKPWKVKE